MLFGSPSNPTGAAQSAPDLAALAALAEREDLWLVSDEIYDRLTYTGTHTSAAAAPGAWERTVVLGGFSKSYAMTGWRVGFVCAPAAVAALMHRIHQYTMLCAPHMSQIAAVEAMKGAQDDVDEMVADYDRRRRLFVKGLDELGLTARSPAARSMRSRRSELGSGPETSPSGCCPSRRSRSCRGTCSDPPARATSVARTRRRCPCSRRPSTRIGRFLAALRDPGRSVQLADVGGQAAAGVDVLGELRERGQREFWLHGPKETRATPRPARLEARSTGMAMRLTFRSASAVDQAVDGGLVELARGRRT